MPAGRCRYCGCTDATPCAGGCAWTDATQTVCSLCQVAVAVATPLVEVLARAISRQAAARRVTLPAWGDLELHDQQGLVLATRATVDALQEALLEGLTADAVTAAVELNAIEAFLLAHCPAELQSDEPTSAIVTRLLAPHVGSRLVLP